MSATRGLEPLAVLALVLAASAGCADSGGDPSDAPRRMADSPRAPSAPQAGAGGASGGEIPGGMITPLPTPTPTARAGAGGMGECASTSKTAEVQHAPVDIVWAIDTSASMVDEIAAVEANITQFASMISMAGIDHHVVMLALVDIAAATPLAADSEHYQYVLAPVGSNDALQVMLDSYDAYSAFLRPNASLHFVVVTDDESWLPAADFQSQMETRAGKKFYFHSIASPDSPGPCAGACGLPIVCGAFAAGVQYYALSDATGGQKISVCTADWTQVFAPLQQAVIASSPLPCDYPIPEPPPGQTFDVDRVNMEFAPAQGGMAELFKHAAKEEQCATNVAWFYDDPDAPSMLRLCPSACERVRAVSGTINIAFGCETKLLTVE